MKLRTIIVDDEQNNVDNLFQLLARGCPEVEVVATAGSADEGRQVILQHSPDLVFLDIQMPGKNGFELLTSLSHCRFDVVFVTAYDQYAIQAIKFSAIDYLQKPIATEDLQRAVQKVAARQSERKQNAQLENLVQLLSRQKEVHRIALPTQKEIRFIPVNEIVRCESSNNYTRFFLNTGEAVLVSKPIYEYEALLRDYGFFRCHQSHLVQVACIRSWVKEEGGYLLTSDGGQVPVSRAKKEALAKALRL